MLAWSTIVKQLSSRVKTKGGHPTIRIKFCLTIKSMNHFLVKLIRLMICINFIIAKREHGQ